MSADQESASTPTPFDLYKRYFEYERVITKVVVTDEGIYQKDEVPDSYGGAQLEMDYVNAVYMVNGRAELLLLEFAGEEPMDKDKKRGGKIMRDGVEIRPQTGDSTTPVVQTTVVNDKLDDARKALGRTSKEQFKIDLGNNPAQPKS